jgi:hypothetical protein
MILSENNRQMILGALDSLGVALTNHDHQWTEGERTIYEMSVEALKGGKQNEDMPVSD